MVIVTEICVSPASFSLAGAAVSSPALGPAKCSRSQRSTDRDLLQNPALACRLLLLSWAMASLGT